MSGKKTEHSNSQTTRRRAALGYDARSERRTVRGAARRRKARTKLWLVAGPAVALIAVVVVLLVLLGGPSEESAVVVTSTTVPLAPTGGADLLVIEEGGSTPVFVVVQPRDDGGLVLALPGITLLKTSEAFRTLSEMAADEEGALLEQALEQELGVDIDAKATVPWPGLRAAMVSNGVTDLPAASLVSSDSVAGQVARAMLALLEAGGTESRNVWEQLELGDDAAAVSVDMRAVAASAGAGGWTAAALAGRVVTGEGFEYLEPEIHRARVLLAGPTGGDTITVEIQNGAGMVGAVEQATAELELLGYTLIAAGNSEDFPNVTKTRIVVALDATQAGARVQALLGVGSITEDDMLDDGYVVVVLGADYVPAASVSTASPVSTAPSG